MNRLVPGQSLAVFRFFFGLLIFTHAVTKSLSGVVHDIFIEPQQLWPFIGFEWLPRLSPSGFYFAFGVVGLSGLLIAAGLFFRAALAGLLLSFGYLFLIEEPNYQNHYYLMLLFAGLLMISNAGQVFSLDNWRADSKNTLVPEVDYHLLRFQMGVVYFFAGVAKINGDWLRGEPLREWLARRDLAQYAMPMSYGGLLFDLVITPLLLWRPTRNAALLAAVGFHVANHFLFPIGVFPLLAVSATLLFLDYDWPSRSAERSAVYKMPGWKMKVALIWCLIQILLPLRHWAYPGRVAWTLDGFYFSWMMRLNNRLGSGSFYVETDKGRLQINPSDSLTPLQAEAARTNPNEILKFARSLRARFESEGQSVHRVTADLNMRVNDHPERAFVDPERDLSREPYGVFRLNRWILQETDTDPK